MQSVKGQDIQAGHIIKSAHHWYRIIKVDDRSEKFFIDAFVSDMRGQMHWLIVGRDDDYPMRVAGS